jgi:hypothetical protein
LDTGKWSKTIAFCDHSISAPPQAIINHGGELVTIWVEFRPCCLTHTWWDGDQHEWSGGQWWVGGGKLGWRLEKARDEDGLWEAHGVAHPTGEVGVGLPQLPGHGPMLLLHGVAAARRHRVGAHI